jgi:hypothetical protein
MAENGRENIRPEVIGQPEGAWMNATGAGEAQGLAGRFDPFHDPCLTDPSPFFTQARAALAAGRVGRLTAIRRRADSLVFRGLEPLPDRFD